MAGGVGHAVCLALLPSRPPALRRCHGPLHRVRGCLEDGVAAGRQEGGRGGGAQGGERGQLCTVLEAAGVAPSAPIDSAIERPGCFGAPRVVGDFLLVGLPALLPSLALLPPPWVRLGEVRVGDTKGGIAGL